MFLKFVGLVIIISMFHKLQLVFLKSCALPRNGLRVDHLKSFNLVSIHINLVLGESLWCWLNSRKVMKKSLFRHTRCRGGGGEACWQCREFIQISKLRRNIYKPWCSCGGLGLSLALVLIFSSGWARKSGTDAEEG